MRYFLRPTPRTLRDRLWSHPRGGRPAPTRWISQGMLLIAIALVGAAHWHVPGVRAQDEAAEPAAEAPPAAAPVHDPVLDDNGILEARRATSWREGEVRWVLLEEDVRFSIGNYGFRGDRALVRIEPQRLPGQTIHRIATYIDNAQSLGRGRIEAEAPRLLVTVSTRGKLELSTDLLTPTDRPPADAFVTDGLTRVAEHLAATREQMAPLKPGPQLFGPEAEAQREARRREIEEARRELHGEEDPLPPRREPTPPKPPLVERPTPEPGDEPIEPSDGPAAPRPVKPIDPAVVAELDDQQILPGRGVVTIAASPDQVIESAPIDEDSRYIAVTGGVQVMYQDIEHGRTVTLSAENIVIFLNVGRTEELFDQRRLDAENVTGIYLEDNVVVTDGLYTVRAPRVFIDPKANRAVVLDAVVYAIDVNRQIPLFIRADQLRQESRTSWSGQNVTLTTSEFAKPHFAIGSGRLRFDQIVDEQTGEVEHHYEARDATFRVGDVPVFYWPALAGDATAAPPIRSARIGYRKNDSHFYPEIETRWDLFALSGNEAPRGVELLGDLDYRGDHGAALGFELDYDVPGMYGNTRGYLLPYDTGTDRVGGRDIEFDGDTRGFVDLKHRQYLRYDLELSLELGYASDPTFLEEFFPSEAYASKPYETSIYINQQQDDRAFSFLARYDVNDFLPQLSELQAPGYFVEKMPELAYRQVGTSLFDDRVTYYTENRLSRLRIRGGDDTPGDRGFSAAESMMLFGITPTTTFNEALAMRGIPRDYRLRLDSRHELQAPSKLGIIDVVPYVAGRITAYDDDFSEFSGEEDNARLWGMVGSRFHTQFSREYNGVESRLFDLHRLRHIIEPTANVFLIGSTINPEDLPVYDADVESLQEGFGTRLGVRHTFQTQRGGEGAWRSVDWLVINTDYVYRSDDADVRTDIARFFDYRPEYSVGGEHLYADVRWALSDSVALLADVTYSLEDDDVPLWHLGAQVQHTPRFRTFIEYAEVEIIDSELLTWGFNYTLTPKYSFAYQQRVNLGESETQDLTLTLERRLPQWRVLIQFRHDGIDDEQSIGIALVPELFNSRTPLFGP